MSRERRMHVDVSVRRGNVLMALWEDTEHGGHEAKAGIVFKPTTARMLGRELLAVSYKADDLLDSIFGTHEGELPDAIL